MGAHTRGLKQAGCGSGQGQQSGNPHKTTARALPQQTSQGAGAVRPQVWGVRTRVRQCRECQPRQGAALQRLPLLKHADGAADGLRRQLVVPGNDHHTDAGGVAVLNGGAHLWGVVRGGSGRRVVGGRRSRMAAPPRSGSHSPSSPLKTGGRLVDGTQAACPAAPAHPSTAPAAPPAGAPRGAAGPAGLPAPGTRGRSQWPRTAPGRPAACAPCAARCRQSRPGQPGRRP